MKINTRELDKINQAYNGDHDLGPDAPVQWSVFELAYMVGKLVKIIEEQDERIERLQSRVEDMARRTARY